MCDQQSVRSAYAYTQSDQSLCYPLEYSMSVKQAEKEDAQARLSLHLSKSHIDGNHMSRSITDRMYLDIKRNNGILKQ